MSAPGRDAQGRSGRRLGRVYGWYAGGLAAFIVAIAILEQVGLPRAAIGYLFLAATVLLYAGIGLVSRTADAAEYYVAGRGIPPIFNGMATAADWMSAASFISMAGTLYLTGYGGLAFIMGWSGGYCLVALLLAPYLRRFGEFTVPDFLGARYASEMVRAIAALAAILCSFTYVVAQLYAVGLVTTWLTGVAFEIGIFLALGGILVCSFLGGMRAVTWTQVAQYLILIVAYLTPVVWLSVKHTGFPVPQFTYGIVLDRVSEREEALAHDAREQEVRQTLRDRAERATALLNGLPGSLAEERARLVKALADAKRVNAPTERIADAQAALDRHPRNAREARAIWSKEATLAERAAPPVRHAEPFPGNDEKTRNTARLNFLALVFCLMVGTAGLPHILTRYYTTPTVRAARDSVTWTIFFVFLLYVTAPALAVLAKYDVLTNLVGSAFSNLPGWVASWSKIDQALFNVTDINRDGIVQLAEISIRADVIVLALPEIAGLPYVVSGLVAAGALAAALSTADGLLLTIASAISHDLYAKLIGDEASSQQQVMLAKISLLIVALAAAWVASQKPADIVFLVSAAFSLAAAAFFPALVLGVFWKRTNKWGAAAGMLAGVTVTFYYMAVNEPWLRKMFGVTAPIADTVWWNIQPISAGVFGVPIGFAVMIIMSLVTRAPTNQSRQMVEQIRYPRPD